LGFDERYFLYLEDFDMCMRMNGIAVLVFHQYVLPIVAGMARKGGRHIAMFVNSAVQCFSRWGWKWW
jgi:hypothetical protein